VPRGRDGGRGLAPMKKRKEVGKKGKGERTYRGPNHRKSARGVLGSRDLAVSTVLIEGSVWSMEVLFWEENFVRSYFYISISLGGGKGGK
jgi:hypothetical protein